MNNLLFNILLTIDINITNFSENWITYAFNPYTSMFGNLTWGFIFGFIGAGIYVGSKSVQAVFTYLVIVGLIFGVLLPEALTAIFVFVLVFMGSSAIYILFIQSKEG